MKSQRPAPNRSLFASIRAIRGLSSVFPPSALRSPVSSPSGSALILTLLITALLATIAVSFLSTSRVEQIAARNFSRQNAASGLAELATGQAMAQIQKGFTVNGTDTAVITTQPGAIRRFVFSGGSVTSNTTTELFSGASGSAATTNGTANLNNFQNPGNSTSNATSNQWTITGNLSEGINVPMEEVKITENGTDRVVGRIAYYVDDEGTKLNLNSATGNRTALNASTNRPLSLNSVTSLPWGQNFSSTRFSNIIDGNTYNVTNDIKSWSQFFRPEQVMALGAGLNATATPINLFTTATTSASTTANMSHLLTPWGTQRLYINELSTNATDGNGTASVNTIHSALTNSTLTTIFGGNFSDKYTSTGVKQIAANMLQMRDPNTATVNASFGYNGPILCDSLGPDPDPYDASQYYIGIPENYLANTPFPVINEIGFSAKYSYTPKIPPPGYNDLRLFLGYYIELFNPYDIPYTNTTNATIVLRLDKIQFRTNTTGNTTIGVPNDYRQYQMTNLMPIRWGWNEANINNTRVNLDAFGRGGNGQGGADAIFFIPSIPARSTKIVFLDLVTQWRGAERNSTVITGNVTTRIERILLLANRDDPRSIRDAISGNDTGDFVDVNPWKGLSTTPAQPWKHPAMSFKRLDARNKTTRNGTATGAFNISGNVSITSTDTITSSSYHDHIAPAPDSTSGYAIPGDPVLGNRTTYLLSSNATALTADNLPPNADKLSPVLDFPVFSSPADLGKVPTNTLYRSLRMQMQPANEGARIPDWAMLDVISFGNSTNPNLPYNRMLPVNINGMFHLPGNATIAPRTIGVRALAQVLSHSGNSSIQDPTNPTSSLVPLNSTETNRFKGNATTSANVTTIAGNIGNMTWSANSTWGNATTGKRWKINNNTPINNYILPSEIMEIAGVADAFPQTSYSNNSTHFKWNEGRVSALIPAVTTRSSFFMIYAYAQALDKNQIVDSEALTKTMVEVQYNSGNYTVKKLYTQPIPMGQ
jgi:hypothetical protein